MQSQKQNIYNLLNKFQLDAYLIDNQKNQRLKRGPGSQFSLLTFKEQYDQGSLAHVAKICVGDMCGKCKEQSSDNNSLRRLLKRKQKKVNNVCHQQSYRKGLYANEFLMLLDTGSTNVFLIGSQCNTIICENHNKYDVNWQGKDWEKAIDKKIAYVSGDNSGKIIYDDISIGDLKISDQPFFIANVVNLEIATGSSWDGILGLGYWFDVNNQVPITEKSIIDKISETPSLLDRQVFTYYIPEGKEAKASFGVIVDELKDEFDSHSPSKILWTKVSDIDEESQWQTKIYNIQLKTSQKGLRFKMKRFSKAKIDKSSQQKIKFQIRLQKFIQKSQTNQLMCQDGCKLLVDTGTYLNYVPKLWFLQFFPENLFRLEPSLCKDLSQLPNLLLTLKDPNGKQFDLELTAKQYMDKIGDTNQCVPSICPDTIENDLITLGQVFLKNFYTIFDFQQPGVNKKIGFYPVDKLNSMRLNKQS